MDTCSRHYHIILLLVRLCLVHASNLYPPITSHRPYCVCVCVCVGGGGGGGLGGAFAFAGKQERILYIIY